MVKTLPARFLKGLIRLYALCISPLMGPNCRFYPTCSHYAHSAVAQHGAVKGLWLSVKRIAKCHPFHKGPYIDPVPACPQCAGEDQTSKTLAKDA